jgi:hypothetical protein
MPKRMRRYVGQLGRVADQREVVSDPILAGVEALGVVTRTTYPTLPITTIE